MLDKTTYRYAIVGLSVAVGLFLVGASLIAALGHAVPKELWTVGTALGGGLLGILVPSPHTTSVYKKAVAEANTAHNIVASAAAAKATQPVKPRAGARSLARADKGETATQAVARVRLKAEAAAKDVGDPSHLSLAIAAASARPGVGAACEALAAQHLTKARELTEEAQAPGLKDARRDELMAQAGVFTAAALAAQSTTTRGAAKAALNSTSAAFPDYFGKLAVPLVVAGVALYVGTHLAGMLPARGDFAYALKLSAKTPDVLNPYLEALARRQQTLINEGDQLLALATAAGGAVVGVLAPSPGQQKTPAEPATN
jgi:hypothetical protein